MKSGLLANLLRAFCCGCLCLLIMAISNTPLKAQIGPPPTCSAGIDTAQSMRIAVCDTVSSCVTLSPNGVLTPSSPFTSHPGIFIISAEAPITVSIQLPHEAAMGVESFPISFSNISAGWNATGGTNPSNLTIVDPHVPFQLQYDSCEMKYLYLGVTVCVPGGSYSGTYTANVGITFDYSGGLQKGDAGSKSSLPVGHSTLGTHTMFTMPISITVVSCDTMYQPCAGSIVSNGGFNGGLGAWTAAYGSPSFKPGSGGKDPGFVRISGSKKGGDAIAQVVSPHIMQGGVYELVALVRVASTSPLPYLKIRAVAFNGSLPADGTHPKPDKDIAIIDYTGKMSPMEWTEVIFHRWRANYNFTSIALNVQSSDSTIATIADIDNICFAQVNDSIPCYEDTEEDSVTAASEDDTDFEEVYMGRVNDLYANCTPAPNGVDTWYEDSDCPDDTCDSVGGTIPPEVENFFRQDSLGKMMQDSLGITPDEYFAEQHDLLDSLTLIAGNPLDTLLSLGALPAFCDTLLPPKQDPGPSDDPFQGRDIVFLHGLRLTPLTDRLALKPEAFSTWPSDRAAFYTGYWKQGANAYWYDHIAHYLGVSAYTGARLDSPGIGYKNRFLVVTHASTQPFAYGAHAILDQIIEAMKNRTGVKKCSINDGRDLEPFGARGFIIISHSDGAPLADIVLAVANLSKYGTQIGLKLGNISAIADYCDMHVALHGALAGSGYAQTILWAVKKAQTGAGGGYAGPLYRQFLGDAVGLYAGWMNNSELRDMSLTKKLWGHLMKQVSSPVLTVAGGDASSLGLDKSSDFTYGLSFLPRQLLHWGFDDGVLSMEGQAGNPDDRDVYPEKFLPMPGKLTIAASLLCVLPGDPDPQTCLKYAMLLNEREYDMGNPFARSFRYYLDSKLDILTSDLLHEKFFPNSGGISFDQVHDLLAAKPKLQHILDRLHDFASVFKYAFASAGVIPNVTPTGMVQSRLLNRIPFLGGYDATAREDNHYSFIQTAADHFLGSSEPDHIAPGAPGHYPDYLPTLNKRNYEETRTIDNDEVYTKGYVSNAMRNMQLEFWRFKQPKKGKKHVPWLLRWKRKYHLLEGFDTMNESDYVYKYILKP